MGLYFEIKSEKSELIICSTYFFAIQVVEAGFLLAFGKLGDIHGFRRIFIAGFAVFTLGSLLCGLSNTIYHLIAFRVLQGIGGAALVAVAPAMVVVFLPADKRGWAFGIIATVVSLGIAAGPILGRFLTEYLSWHWIFFINVPFGIAAVCAAYFLFPKDRAVHSTGKFDVAGSVLICAALTTLLYPLNQGLSLGWTSPAILGLFVLSLILWISFFVHERRCSDPLVDLTLFRNRNFNLGNSTGLLMMLSYAGAEFLLPFFFENIHGYTPSVAGLLLAVPAVALMVVGPAAGAFSDKYGSRAITSIAALLAAISFSLFSMFTMTTSLGFIIAALILFGIAVGLFFPPNMSQILTDGGGDGRSEGVVSSVMMTIRNTGSVLGVALFSTIVVQVILGLSPHAADATTGAIPPQIFVAGFQFAFVFGIILSIVTLALSVSIVKRKAAILKDKT
ncbi:MAG: DHA2 family efflux MFS transporter permease subunit [Methanoregula sp.]|nr:DHA2 family efflux MFS transporter permease subunit [Methanoregula sp.]